MYIFHVYTQLYSDTFYSLPHFEKCPVYIQHLTGTLHECLHAFLERKTRSGFTWVLRWRDGNWLKIGSRSMEFEIGVTRPTRSSTWVDWLDLGGSTCWSFMILLMPYDESHYTDPNFRMMQLEKPLRMSPPLHLCWFADKPQLKPGGIEHVLNHQGSPVLGFSDPLSHLALMINSKSGYVEQ